MQCFEADGSECPLDRHGIETNLETDDFDAGGVIIQHNDSSRDTITRFDGGSFWDDGHFEGEALRIQTGGNNTDVTIDEISGDGTVIFVSSDDVLEDEGNPEANITVNFLGFSYLVTHRITGRSPCYMADEETRQLLDVTPKPVLMFDWDFTYTANQRDGTSGKFISTGFITNNPPHDIKGTLTAADGANFAAVTDCSPGVPCMVCYQELAPGEASNKALLEFYATEDPYDLFQSFNMVEHSDGTADIASRAATSKPFATTETDPAVCASRKYTQKGGVTEAGESYTGAVLLDGKVVGGTVQVGGNSETDTLTYTFNPTDPTPYFTCDQILKDAETGNELVVLAGEVPPSGPGNTQGNGNCQFKFNTNAVAAALDKIKPLEDGDLVEVRLTGSYVDGANTTPFSAGAIARLEFNFEGTVGFVAATSEGAEGADVNVSVRLSADPIATVSVRVRDTRTGTANKKDAIYPAPNTDDVVTFAPGGPLTQSVTVRLLSDNPPDTDTIIFGLTDVQGAAEIDTTSDEHTLTILSP
jgi:hypothetical protein